MNFYDTATMKLLLVSVYVFLDESWIKDYLHEANKRTGPVPNIKCNQLHAFDNFYFGG